MHAMVLLITFTFTFLLLSNQASGDTYHLFAEPDLPVENYNDILPRIKAGDVLTFGRGERFEIKGYLGEGQKAKVFSLGDGWALRVPLHSIPRSLGLGYQRDLLKYFDAAITLLRLDAPVPEIGSSRETALEYIRIREVQKIMDFEEFAYRIKSNSEAEELKSAAKSLVDFASRTAHIKSIRDLHYHNLVYTPGGWIILDFADHITNINMFTYRTPEHLLNHEDMIDAYRVLPSLLKKKVEDAITERRKHLSASAIFRSRCSLAERALAPFLMMPAFAP